MTDRHAKLKIAANVIIWIIGLSICTSAKAALIVTPIVANIAVPETKGGTLSWSIQNTDLTLTVTLNNDLVVENPQFMYVGGDMDDQPLRTTIAGCGGGVTLVPSGMCVFTVGFTSPAVPDTTNDEDGNRGFANLVRTVSFVDALTVHGCTNNTTTCLAGDPSFVTSSGFTGLVEVDDPGVQPIIPEPSTILLMASGLTCSFSYRQWRRSVAKVTPEDTQAAQKA